VPFFLLIPILIVLSIAFLIAAIMAVVFLTVLAITGLAAGFILHKLGYDRRLIVHFMHKGPAPRRAKGPVDDLGVPIAAAWRFEDQRPG
jgi:hypothetical protein